MADNQGWVVLNELKVFPPLPCSHRSFNSQCRDINKTTELENLLFVAAVTLLLTKSEVEEKGVERELEPGLGDERNSLFREGLSWIWILHPIRDDSSSWKREKHLSSCFVSTLLKPQFAIDGHSN